MKTTYRLGSGRFIQLDSTVRPRWQTFLSYLRPRPHAGAFLASFILSLVAALALSPLNDDDLTPDELGYDEANLSWDLREIEHQYTVQHCERCWKQRAVEPPRT